MDIDVMFTNLDGDDTHCYESALNNHTDEVTTLACRPTLTRLLQQLAKLANALLISSAESIRWTIPSTLALNSA